MRAIIETAIEEAKDKGDSRDEFELYFREKNGRIEYLIHVKEYRRGRTDVGGVMSECEK